MGEELPAHTLDCVSALDAFLVAWSRARDTFGAGVPETGDAFDQSGHLQALGATAHTAAPGPYWSGEAATAYGGKNAEHAHVIAQLAGLDKRLGLHITESAQVVSTGRQNLDSIKSWVLAAAQSVPAGPRHEPKLVPIVQTGVARIGEVVSTSNNELNAVGAKLRQVGNEYARLGVGGGKGEKAPAEEKSEHDPTIRTVDFKQTPSGQAEDLANRRQNQIDAFSEIFGRGPSSATDWQTAAALDPHSYDPDTDGVPPEVRVVKIRPVPGQGVVRVGQWIEQRDVISGPWKRDFGNIRPADPNFDPANTKVTTYIDYENGLVVMRQNPSVELTPDGGPGQVKVGIPEAVVQQTDDGAVRIKYEAANPFAPDIAKDPPWPMENNPWTVNGDLVFTPTADGVRVDGTRTDYPSMEVYQNFPDGSTRTVLIDPAIAGNSTGPMVNLPQHHDIGAGGSAFAPFDSGGWNPDYDVPIPLPWTEFGAPGDPPHVPSIPLPPGVTPV
ncbi:hypothetical protein BCL50_1876 [Mycolicibacterium litorale]|nr:hypothetical protein BCL50_1876 [Mycolicibacterium litorale]